MTQAFVVLRVRYGGADPAAVFATREEAEAFVRRVDTPTMLLTIEGPVPVGLAAMVDAP